MSPTTVPASARPLAKPERDVRLDFFRGIGMFIIFMAHLPGNTWTLWIPARFGFSDATEIFVFCSGMASALAFGVVFDRHGWLIGAARVVHRMWQVYWAHICCFLIVAALMAFLEPFTTTKSAIGQLNLFPFFGENTPQQLVGLLTLTYVPNYFDILPMYLVILALLPIVAYLGHVHPGAAGAFIVGLWLIASLGYLDLPAEPWSDRNWFFNPFAWQLVFFTGFAFIRGWLPAPPVNRPLIYAAIAVLVLSLPLAYTRIYWGFGILNDYWPAVREIREDIRFLITKTDFGALRYLHFLALAYLAYVWAGPKGVNIPKTGVSGRLVDVVRQVGQQSLAVFLASLVIAQFMGFVLREFDRGLLTMATVNLVGFALLVVVARVAAWFKAQPWRRQPSRTQDGAEPHASAAPASQAMAFAGTPAAPHHPPQQALAKNSG